MLDLGLLMYFGLLVLALWRVFCFYRCCGLWLSFMNYTSLLYLILTASLVYAVIEFYERLNDPLVLNAHPDAAQVWSIGWLRPFVMGAPGAVVMSVVLCWFQTEGHVFEIHKDIGTVKHDRAVQIIALPSVFAVMALASMVPIYELVTGNISPEMLNIPFGIDIRSRLATASGHSDSEGSHHNVASLLEQEHLGLTNLSAFTVPIGHAAWHLGANSSDWEKSFNLAMWRYETCFYVGDLFEAWALYQFGLLALDLIKESYENKMSSENEVERGAAKELLASLSAVSSLAWLGTVAFVVVCVGQTACSLSPYLVGLTATEHNDNIMKGFQVAGFIASSVALYNVFVVERAFHAHLERSSPLLKFLSVKILVSLSFFQRGLLVMLQGGNKLLPSIVQRLVGYVPLFGDILNMTEVQLHLFYPALILYECFLTTLLHFWAWNPTEPWYATGDIDEEDGERRPLVPKQIAGEA